MHQDKQTTWGGRIKRNPKEWRNKMEKEKKRKHKTANALCLFVLLTTLQVDIIITSVLSEVYKQGIYMK